MVFAKQYSRKAGKAGGGVGLSIAPAPHKFEVSTKKASQIWAQLLYVGCGVTVACVCVHVHVHV